MRRRGLASLWTVAVIGVAGTTTPAWSADAGPVIASDFTFTPRTVTVAPGDRVTFGNLTGSHNVKFDDDMLPLNDIDQWIPPPVRSFDTVGDYRFFCEAHPGAMVGFVYVREGGAPPPEPPPVSSPPPPPVLGTPPGTRPPAARPVGATPSSFTLSAVRSGFCTRRSASCRRPGVLLRVDVAGGRAVTLAGTLRRRPLRGAGRVVKAGDVRFPARPGAQRIRLRTTDGRILAPGRYTLSLAATGGGSSRTTRFSVRSS